MLFAITSLFIAWEIRRPIMCVFFQTSILRNMEKIYITLTICFYKFQIGLHYHASQRMILENGLLYINRLIGCKPYCYSRSRNFCEDDAKTFLGN